MRPATPVDPFADAAALLEERSRRELGFQPDFDQLEPTDAPRRTVAVDGSHAVLVDNGSVWVVAVRAVAVTWREGSDALLPVDPVIHTALPGEAPQQVADAYEAMGLDAPRIGSAEAYAEAMRDLAELRAARAALEEMGDADLLLVDGALENLPKGPQQMVDRSLEKAASRNVPVVGVAKQSRLHIDGVPLVPALQARGPEGMWAVPVPDYRMAHVVRLHAGASHAFRLDATDAGVLPRLLPLCRDAVYLGYPYPLAVAHNAVALTASHIHDLRARLVEAVGQRAGPEAFRLLEDFHAVLDRNVPG